MATAATATDQPRAASQTATDPFAAETPETGHFASSGGGPTANHDPLLHAHLLQSRYRGPARTIRSKWRHVVLNLRSGDLKIYRVEQQEITDYNTKNPSSPIFVNSRNRCKSELFFLPRSGGKAAALVSTLPDESDLELHLPSGSWEMRDLVGNDTAFIIKYDLRSSSGASAAMRRAKQRRRPSASTQTLASQDMTLTSTASRASRMKNKISSLTHKLVSKKKKKNGKPQSQEEQLMPRTVKFQSPEKKGEDDFFADGVENNDDGTINSIAMMADSARSLPQHEHDIKEDDAISISTLTDLASKSRGRITLRCPGGGNEKAMWQKAAGKCSGIRHVPGDIIPLQEASATTKRSVIPQSVSSQGKSAINQGKSAMKYISKSKPVSKIGSAATKAVPGKPKNVTWRYRKDFTAVGALNMSVMVRGPLPHFANELHQSINQDDDDISYDPAQDEDDSGRIKEYKVQPAWAYPNVWMTPQELKREMLRKSGHFHDLRNDIPTASSSIGSDGTKQPRRIGSLHIEVLSCHGLPRKETVANSINLSDGSGGAVVYLVAGTNAFCTDTIPGIKDHFWLRKTKRAVIFPLHHPYVRLYAGVFDADTHDFAGRAVIDVAELRPNSLYNVTLPLRQSAQLYRRTGRGTIQLRFKLEWDDEKAAVMSYLPPVLRAKPVSIPCGDKVAFRNVARTVHGDDMHGKWSRTIQRATTRELKLYKKHTKALARQIVNDISGWVRPTFSLYVFWGWMHCVYRASVALALPYIFGFVVLWLLRNYATYVLGSSRHMGYAPATIRELLSALLSRKASSKHNIHPLEVTKHSTFDGPPRPQNALAAKMFSLLGLKEDEAALADIRYHLEFPFSDDERQRKLTMAESYAKDTPPETPTNRLPGRGRPSAAITEEDLFSFGDDVQDDGDGADDASSKSVSSLGGIASPRYQSTPQTSIEHITPDQNMDVKVKGTTIFEDLEEFKGIAHSATLGLVNDRVVTARRLVSRSSVPIPVHSRNFTGSFSESQHSDLDFDIADDNEPILAIMEKSLGIGVQRNPVLVMQQKFAGPVVQIQRVGLIAFRSIFNLFMWSDPFASFWLLVILFSLVAVTALFPWRIAFFASGVAFVGPQNWLLRIRRERNPRPQQEDKSKLDKSPKADDIPNQGASKSSSTDQLVSAVRKRFSNEAEDNVYDDAPRPFISHANQSKGSIQDALWFSKKGETALSEVVVPYSPLRQERFYDWPPERSHSKCKSLLQDVKAVYCSPNDALESTNEKSRSNTSTPQRYKKDNQDVAQNAGRRHAYAKIRFGKGKSR